MIYIPVLSRRLTVSVSSIMTELPPSISAIPDTVNISRGSSKSSGKTVMPVQLMSVPVEVSTKRIAFSGAKSIPPVCGGGWCECVCMGGRVVSVCMCFVCVWLLKYSLILLFILYAIRLLRSCLP